MVNHKSERQKAAEIVRDAGGEIVGRTKLQKVAYLLEIAGFGDGFAFEYRHYGPYSEELANAIQLANAFGFVIEDERKADWGGMYSIYTATDRAGPRAQGARSAFAERAARIGSIELELAATAAYLNAVEGYTDPWNETARRKPEKVGNGRLEKAKQAYRQLLKLETRRPLPQIA